MGIKVKAPSSEWSIPLHRAGGRELFAHRLIFGVLWLIGLLFVAGGASACIEDTAGKGQVLLGLLVIVLTELGRRFHLRAVAPGALSVRGSELEIVDRQLLRRPLRVPLANVRVAAVESDGSSQSPEGLHFPVLGDLDGPLADRVRGHLLADDPALSPLRLLGRSAYTPNLVILFEEPLLAPRLRLQVPHGPQRSEALGGLALHAADPEQARTVFRELKVRSEIRESDAEHLFAINAGEVRAPDEGAISFAQAERRKVRNAGWGAIAIGLVLPPVELGGLIGAWAIWREGLRFEAAAMALCATTLLGFHLWVLAHPPLDDPWRFIAGAIMTVVVTGPLLHWMLREQHSADAAQPPGA